MLRLWQARGKEGRQQQRWQQARRAGERGGGASRKEKRRSSPSSPRTTWEGSSSSLPPPPLLLLPLLLLMLHLLALRLLLLQIFLLLDAESCLPRGEKSRRLLSLLLLDTGRKKNSETKSKLKYCLSLPPPFWRSLNSPLPLEFPLRDSPGFCNECSCCFALI